MTSLTSSSGALSGVRILDMATVLAAPLGATLCADQGADVIKLELPDGSDALRGLQPVKDGHSLWWKVANRGKRGITLDVRQSRGRELFLEMLPNFDVLLENFRTGTLDRWGLDLATLHKANPRLVVVRLTGFGQTGPYSQRPGYARIFEAMSGDAVAGLFCAFSIASEMVRIRSDPQALGAEVDLAATEALFRLLDPLPVEYELLGQIRRPAGNLASYTAPSNMYQSADGQCFSLVASSNSIFARLCEVVGHSEWASDPRFSTNPARVRHLNELDAGLSSWFLQRNFADIAPLLEEGGVPFSKVYTIEDIVNDPHYQARQAIIRMPDPELGTVPAPCIVPRVSGRAMSIPRTGPATGEHNVQFYGEMGIDEQALERLRALGVI